MSSQPPYPPPSSPPPGYPPRRPGRGPVIAAVVVALLIVGGLGYWFGGRDSGSTPTGATVPTGTSAPATTPSSLASVPASVAPSAAQATGPTSDGGDSSAVAPPPTSSSPHSTSVSASPTTSAPSHPDPDFGYVKGVTTSGGVSKISFDRATLLSGAAAASAAKAHGQEVEDDYFIVNDNPLIRTFELSPSVVVSGSSNLSGDVGPKPSTLAALRAWLQANPAQLLPVDLSYDAAGKVTKIAEVFFP